jgi:hypothetical protein
MDHFQHLNTLTTADFERASHCPFYITPASGKGRGVKKPHKLLELSLC